MVLRQPVRPLDSSLWLQVCSSLPVLPYSVRVPLVRSSLPLWARLLPVQILVGLKLRLVSPWLVSPWLDHFLELNLRPVFCPHWLAQFHGCSRLLLGLNLPDLSLESMRHYSQVWFLPVPFLEWMCSAFQSLFPPVRCPLSSHSVSSPPNPCPEWPPEQPDPHRLVGTILLMNSRNLKALVRPSRG